MWSQAQACCLFYVCETCGHVIVSSLWSEVLLQFIVCPQHSGTWSVQREYLLLSLVSWIPWTLIDHSLYVATQADVISMHSHSFSQRDTSVLFHKDSTQSEPILPHKAKALVLKVCKVYWNAFVKGTLGLLHLSEKERDWLIDWFGVGAGEKMQEGGMKTCPWASGTTEKSVEYFHIFIYEDRY